MIDHIYLPVTDLKRSDTFYGGMLGALGKSERPEARNARLAKARKLGIAA